MIKKYGTYFEKNNKSSKINAESASIKKVIVNGFISMKLERVLKPSM